jgi:putative thioredoxin
MAESPHIVQLDEQNFMQVVVEGSDQTPVLVDFWADWCGPCKSLMPILEKLAIEYNGAFILAKLDTEAHPGIAQQLGIKSLPTVKLFKNRELVNEFMGALPESEVRAFLETNVGPALPAEDEEPEEEAGENRVATAMALFEQGKTDEARELLQQAQADEPDNAEVLLALGQICVSTADLDTAESCLKALPETDREGPQGRRLAGILELARESDASVSPQVLKAELEKDPSSSETRYKLAIAEALAGNVQEGMDHLLKLVQTDAGYNDGAPRIKLLALFNVLGDDPLVGQYRRKLFASLH